MGEILAQSKRGEIFTNGKYFGIEDFSKNTFPPVHIALGKPLLAKSPGQRSELASAPGADGVRGSCSKATESKGGEQTSAEGKSTDSLSVLASTVGVKTGSRQGQIYLLTPACFWVPSYATLTGGVRSGLWPLPRKRHN